MDGKPGIIRKGIVLTPPMAKNEWAKSRKDLIAHSCPALFECRYCRQPVYSMEPRDPDTTIQLCQCAVVSHFRGAPGPYKSVESWTHFRSLHRQESARPLPPDATKNDPFTGEAMGLNEKGKTWIRNKLGLSHAIDVTEDGTLIYGDSSLSTDPKTFEQSMICGDDAAFLSQNIASLRATIGAGPNEAPEVIVVLGTDPDYNWPEGARLDRITSLPYRCPSCSARVKRAPVNWPEFNMNEFYCCLCASAMFRRDAHRPKTSGEWQEMRLRYRSQEIKHRAKLAGNKS